VKQFTLRHAFRERTVVIFLGAGRDHLQLVLTDRSPLTQGRDLGVIGTQTWRLADLGTAIAGGLFGFTAMLPYIAVLGL
jgi:hypothetical protein